MSQPLLRLRHLVYLACLAVLGCSRPESTLVVGPRSTEPEVRIGLGVGLPQAAIGGGAGLVVSGAGGAIRAEVPAGASITLSSMGEGLRIGGALSWDPTPGETLVFAPIDPVGFVRVGARDYRGRVHVYAGRNGVTLVNQLGIESYLAGVVSAEMGRRDSADEQAVMAQAVISRTYAMRNRGRWNALGFDFYPTVVDQVYGGVASETPLGWRTVTGTAGQIVGYQGAAIDGFFFSTCGGKTAGGTEVFANAGRPYLVSIDDVDQAGQAYCRISPRYEWRQEWSGEALRDILRESVPATLGRTVSARAVVQSIRIADLSLSGRVARLTIGIDGRQIDATGPAVRQVLRPARGELLRSSMFGLRETTVRGSIARLVVDGHGAGHGVGLCQWGALGRARAGQNYQEILAAYFPHTDLERLY